MARAQRASKITVDKPKSLSQPQDMLDWFSGNFGYYLGFNRGLIISEFKAEFEPNLESLLVNLKGRETRPLVLTYEQIRKQAEFIWDQARNHSVLGNPAKTKAEKELLDAELLVLRDFKAPANEHELWYLLNYVVYPRALRNKATIYIIPAGYEEFIAASSKCPDAYFGNRAINFDKLLFLMESSCVDLNYFSLSLEKKLPPMVKSEYILVKALQERNINFEVQKVYKDHMLAIAVQNKGRKINIEIDPINGVLVGHDCPDEISRTVSLIQDGWSVLRFSTSEIYQNVRACVEAVEEIIKTSEKRHPAGRLVTMQNLQKEPNLTKADPGQYAAVIHGSGPAVLVGNAGTGKTLCLIERIALLLNRNVNPEAILVISKSKAELDQIKAALGQSFSEELINCLALNTCQDIGFRIIKENLTVLKRKTGIKQEPNPQKIIQRLLPKYRKELDILSQELSKDMDEFEIASQITKLKSALISSKEAKQEAKEAKDDLIARVYAGYEEQLQRSNRFDLDDLVYLASKLLLENKDIRNKYQYRYEFVLVDEYEDMSIAEDALIQVLAAPQDGLFLAANPQLAGVSQDIAANFVQDASFWMPSITKYQLENNWRNHPSIVELCNRATGLYARPQGDNYTCVSADAAGAVIGPLHFAATDEELFWMAQEIKALIDTGRKTSEIAVVIAEEGQREKVAACLAKVGLAHNGQGNMNALLPDETGDMLTYLKLVVDPDGPRAREAFEHVCQLRQKEIDPKLSGTIASFAEANNLSYLKAIEIYSEATVDIACRELAQLVRIIRNLHSEQLPPAETISIIKRTQRLAEYYKSIKLPPGIPYTPVAGINVLEEEAKTFTTVASFVRHKSGSDGGALVLDGSDGVSVLDCKQAKGLEFSVVFVPSLADGVFAKSSDDDDQEAELRNIYAAISRAKEFLYLSYSTEIDGVACKPSRLLSSLGLISEESLIEEKVQDTQTGDQPIIESVQVEVAAEEDMSSSEKQLQEKYQEEHYQKLPAVHVEEEIKAEAKVGVKPSETVQEITPSVELVEAVASSPKDNEISAIEAEQIILEQELVQAAKKQREKINAGLQVYKKEENKGPLLIPKGPPMKGEKQSSYRQSAEVVASVEQMNQAENMAAALSGQTQPLENNQIKDQEISSVSADLLCPGCSEAIEPDARFCGGCGMSIEAVITDTESASLTHQCGAIIEPGAKFCGECGLPV